MYGKVLEMHHLQDIKSAGSAAPTVKGTFTALGASESKHESVCAPHKATCFIAILSLFPASHNVFPPAQSTDRLIARRCVNPAADSEVGLRLLLAAYSFFLPAQFVTAAAR